MKKWPVAEIFGPTIQGEGMEQGIPCHFVRFGGCDFRCEWCDTPHAVLPHVVRNLKKMDTNEILTSLDALTGNPGWVVLSGGNPALHDLRPLVEELQQAGVQVAVETQGTKYKEWLRLVDSLCVSPKPPSSGMKYTITELDKFLDSVDSSKVMLTHDELFLKIVVFDRADYEWAKEVHLSFSDVPMFLSTGNDAGKTVGNPGRTDERTDDQIRLDLCHSARRLTNWVMVDAEMADVRVQAQFHVLLWANELGR